MGESIDNFVSGLNSWYSTSIAVKAIDALRKNHFDAGFFDSREEALNVIMDFVKPGMTVAFGGSQTLKQLGLDLLIAEAGAIILDHNKEGLSQEEKIEIMRKQQVCDLFLCSSNAITTQGEIYNIDGNGNRLSALIFGPKKTIIVAGVNKLCLNESSAWDRVRNHAAPINMKRLNRQTPCTEKGVCMDCRDDARGCNIFLALKRKPSLSDISVFIINESLGF
ncbi:MAG: lactate utilization protein [Bacteroidales bacterium]|nr:lactate utilization protein [Bacteroidales bacterium]